MEACCGLQSSELGNTMSSTKVILCGYLILETGRAAPPAFLSRKGRSGRHSDDGRTALAQHTLSEWPAEIDEHPESDEVNAKQGLEARDRPRPAYRLEVVFTLGQQAQPAPKVDVAKTDVERS